MPLYTYRCRTCENEFDIQQRMSEEPLTDCPACGQPQLRKVMNSVGVVFKGNGFYVTDNRNGDSAKSANGGNGKNGESGETATETPAKEAAAKKTESMPATTDTVKSSGASEKVAATAV